MEEILEPRTADDSSATPKWLKVWGKVTFLSIKEDVRCGAWKSVLRDLDYDR
jgi:hypothetical protein